ncbi:hypothetical protein ACI79X_01270 [Geodermatophilus sp. SYSU D01119]
MTANLRVPDVAAAEEFYADFSGLGTEEFNLGWVARLIDPDTGAHVQLVSRDATAPRCRRSRCTPTTPMPPGPRRASAGMRSCTR